MNYEVYFLHADKHWILSFWVSVTRHAQSTQNKFAYLCNISIKAWGMKLIFLPADKPKSFLQDDSIILGLRSQTGPKYQKQPVNKIFAISQGKHEGWSWLFAYSWRQKCWSYFQIDTIIFGVCDQACPNYLKQQVSYFSTTC